MRTRPRTAAPTEMYERNAQHGMNRTGIDLESDRTYEEYEQTTLIDPAEADARITDEGDEIRQRVHARGHDVTEEP